MGKVLFPEEISNFCWLVILYVACMGMKPIEPQVFRVLGVYSLCTYIMFRGDLYGSSPSPPPLTQIIGLIGPVGVVYVPLHVHNLLKVFFYLFVCMKNDTTCRPDI